MSIAVPSDIADKAADPNNAPPPPPPNRKQRRAEASMARRQKPRGPMTRKKTGVGTHKQPYYIKSA